jgi:hypothetical protein
MKLFTKDIDKKLFAQYSKGAELEGQKVIAKIFNPYGRGVWYLLNSDPEDPDYIWAIVDLIDVEMESVSRMELKNIKVPPFNLHLERDLYFDEINAQELWDGLMAGKHYAEGGPTDEERKQYGTLAEFYTYSNKKVMEKFGAEFKPEQPVALWNKVKDGIEITEASGELTNGNKVVYNPEEYEWFFEGYYEKGGPIAKPITFGELTVGQELYQVTRPQLGIEKIKITGKEGNSAFSYISDKFSEETRATKYQGKYSDSEELYGIYANKEDAKQKALELLSEKMSKYAKGGQINFAKDKNGHSATIKFIDKRYKAEWVTKPTKDETEIYELPNILLDKDSSEYRDVHTYLLKKIKENDGSYMEDGGEIDWGADLGNGITVGTDVYITDPKSLFNGRTGFITGKVGKDYLVTISVDGNDRNVVVGKKGFDKIDEPFAEGGKIKNQYEGKTAKKVYELWDYGQKYEFFKDHFQNSGVYTNSEFKNLPSKKYDELDKTAKDVLDKHIAGGQYANGGEIMKHKHLTNVTIELIEPTSKGWKVKQIETHSVGGRKLSTPKEKVAYYSKAEIKDLFESTMAKGGTFVQGVKAIEKQLTGKKVPGKYQSKYGKKYNKTEAHEAATNIKGAMAAKEKIKNALKRRKK